MKEPAKPKAKKKMGIMARAQRAFTRAAIFGTVGMVAIGVGKNRLDRTGDAPKSGPTLSDTFKCSVENEALLKKIDNIINRLEKGDTAHSDFVLMAIDGARFARNRGYGTGQNLVIGNSYQLAANISWDLSVLGFYTGEHTKVFSNDVQDALTEFQKAKKLDVTGQPGTETLRVLGEQAYQQRMLVGLHAWKVAIKRNVPVLDMLAMIGSESSGNRFAKAKTSSAVGLTQFTNETTVFVFAKDGNKLADPCDPIQVKEFEALQRDARAIMKLQSQKKALPRALETSYERMLSMRTNFETSIDLMALYGIRLTGTFSAPKLYPYYFAGPAGGRVLFENQDKTVADLLPAAAKANMRLFYESIEPKTTIHKKTKKKMVVMKDGKPVMVGVNPFTGRQVTDKLAEKVTGLHMTEARATDVIMRNTVNMLDMPLAAENTGTPSPARKNDAIQVK